MAVAANDGIVSVFVPMRIGRNVAELLPVLMIVVSAVGSSLIIAGATRSGNGDSWSTTPAH